MNQIQCGRCGKSDIRTEWGDYTFTYGVGVDSVELKANVPFRMCGDCGFRFLDAEADDITHEAICRHVGLLAPFEVSIIRNRYKMPRKDFAQLTRIGEASLARWESGALFQNGSADSLLYLLSFPANLDRLRTRNIHEPLALAVPSTAVSGEGSFKALSPEEVQRKRQAAATFQLRLR